MATQSSEISVCNAPRRHCACFRFVALGVSGFGLGGLSKFLARAMALRCQDIRAQDSEFYRVESFGVQGVEASGMLQEIAVC